MQMFKLAVLGGGSGLSQLLRGLKKFPFDISAIVSVCDDGSSTGRLREEFHTPAVGDIRKVLISLSENEEEVKELFDYRFSTSSDLDGHALGNLLLTGDSKVKGNITSGIELVNSLLNLKGKVIPLTEDYVTLMGKMSSGKVVLGEHNITECSDKIKYVYYKKPPKVNEDVLMSIRHADAIILSMGSLFTSIIPNLLCRDVILELDKSPSKIIYVCNIMTQPGETDGFSAYDHVKLLNKYLGKHKIDAVILNNGFIEESILKNYETSEQKDLVRFDENKFLKNDITVISGDYIKIFDGVIRHNSLKVALDIMSYLLYLR